MCHSAASRVIKQFFGGDFEVHLSQQQAAMGLQQQVLFSFHGSVPVGQPAFGWDGVIQSELAKIKDAKLNKCKLLLLLVYIYNNCSNARPV